MNYANTTSIIVSHNTIWDPSVWFILLPHNLTFFSEPICNFGALKKATIQIYLHPTHHISNKNHCRSPRNVMIYSPYQEVCYYAQDFRQSLGRDSNLKWIPLLSSFSPGGQPPGVPVVDHCPVYEKTCNIIFYYFFAGRFGPDTRDQLGDLAPQTWQFSQSKLVIGPFTTADESSPIWILVIFS